MDISNHVSGIVQCKVRALVLALVLAAMMIVGSISALAATGELTLDDKITISGLENGDTVKLYKVLKWVDSQGWQKETEFNSTTCLDGLIGTTTPLNTVTLNSEDVAQIKTALNSASSLGAKYDGTASNNKFEVNTPEAGLYIAIITSDVEGVLYNPIIVSADWKTNTSNVIDASTANVPASDSGAAIAKKSKVTLDKTAEDKNTTPDNSSFTDTNNTETYAVGDIVDFTVTTVIPPYADNYTNPTFKLTDVMSTGLAYQTGNLSVTPAGAQYDLTETTSGYVLTFKPAYLTTIRTAQDVTITYKAKVTNSAVKSVNHDTNTVTLEFSHNPNDESDVQKLKDRTNHYTFTIDGELLGWDNYSATEIVKIGVSADGTEITKTTTLSNSNKVGALENATFALYDAAENGNLIPRYINGVQDGNWDQTHIVSGPDGRFTISGLDAGTYYLEEVSAPAGYIKQGGRTRIVIAAETEDVEYEEDGCLIKTTVLKSYTVTIGNDVTATYHIENSSDPTKTKSDKGDTVVGKSGDEGKVKNVQGVELPSTGGIGTTIFYVGGSLMVLAAAILLITKRRMGVED